MYLVRENKNGGWVVVINLETDSISVDRTEHATTHTGLTNDDGIPIHVVCGDPVKILNQRYPLSKEAIGKVKFNHRKNLAGTFMDENLLKMEITFNDEAVGKNKGWNEIQLDRYMDDKENPAYSDNYLIVVGGEYPHVATLVAGSSCESVMDRYFGHGLGEFDDV